MFFFSNFAQCVYFKWGLSKKMVAQKKDNVDSFIYRKRSTAQKIKDTQYVYELSKNLLSSLEE